MLTFIIVVLGIILAGAVIGFLASKSGEKEDGAKMGAMGAAMFIGNLLPTIIVIFLVIVLVRACM